MKKTQGSIFLLLVILLCFRCEKEGMDLLPISSKEIAVPVYNRIAQPSAPPLSKNQRTHDTLLIERFDSVGQLIKQWLHIYPCSELQIEIKNAWDKYEGFLVPDFCGTLLYYKQSGEFIEGFEYQEGQVIGAISQPAKTQTKTRSKICYPITFNYWERKCVYQFINGRKKLLECAVWELIHTHTMEICLNKRTIGFFPDNVVNVYTEQEEIIY